VCQREALSIRAAYPAAGWLKEVEMQADTYMVRYYSKIADVAKALGDEETVKEAQRRILRHERNMGTDYISRMFGGDLFGSIFA
jgi:hypothetical protein